MPVSREQCLGRTDLELELVEHLGDLADPTDAVQCVESRGDLADEDEVDVVGSVASGQIDGHRPQEGARVRRIAVQHCARRRLEVEQYRAAVDSADGGERRHGAGLFTSDRFEQVVVDASRQRPGAA